MDFYSSGRWLRLRAAVLQRDGYECQLAKAQGRKEPAVTVHHIFPREEYPEYQWEAWNLISLSFSAHNKMHLRDSHKLSRMGEALKEETAQKQHIGTDPETILVIGMPGTGKTTYVKQRLKGGVCYDLDYIAGAFTLTKPKASDFKKARWLANDLLPGFVKAAHRYCQKVYVVRTAPTEQELEDIQPTKMIYLNGGYGNQSYTDERRKELAGRIKRAIDWCKTQEIPVEEIQHDY